MSSDKPPDPSDQLAKQEQTDVTEPDLSGLSLSQRLHPAFREFSWAQRLWDSSQNEAMLDPAHNNPDLILQQHLRRVSKLRGWRRPPRRMRVPTTQASSSHSDPVAYQRGITPRRRVATYRGSVQPPRMPSFSKVEAVSETFATPGSSDLSSLPGDSQRPIVHIHHHYYHHHHHHHQPGVCRVLVQFIGTDESEGGTSATERRRERSMEFEQPSWGRTGVTLRQFRNHLNGMLSSEFVDELHRSNQHL
ncbi:hypothetical protein Ciccas_005190, partial [Cichlidogyrus casuarinus]